MTTIKFGKTEYYLNEAQMMEWRASESLRLLDRIIRQRELLHEWGLEAPPVWLQSLKVTVARGQAARGSHVSS